MLFIIVNLITLSNLAPWIDEVMFLDTSYNAAVHGQWETTAWYRVAGQYPFPTYPPLYQMMATVWIWFFGSSLIAVRSMNLLITFLLGFLCLRLMKRHGLQPTPWMTTLFTVLLWGTSEMAWMYRNGRPDMLCTLLLILTLLATDRYLSTKSLTTRITVIVTSALLFCSGIQAAVYLCALWLFFFIVTKGRHSESIRVFILLKTGILTGTLLVALFMLAHGRLVGFVSSIIQYSSTLSGIALVMLPWVGEAFGFPTAPYTQKLLELKTDSSLSERLVVITEYHSFLLLSAVAFMAYIVNYRDSRKKLLHDKGFLLLLCALYVPFIMILAGRFSVYYRWMAFLPLLASVTYIASRYRWWRIAFCLIAVLLTVYGIRSMFPRQQWDYENLRSFVQRQHFKSSDAVICPFSLFYEMKPVCDTCYFAGIFPAEYIRRVDYIFEANDDNGFDLPITDYVNRLRLDSTVVLTLIDRCEQPSLTLYHVQQRHE